MVITINGTLPNLNDYTKACRSNKFAGSNMKKTAQKIIVDSVPVWYIGQTLKMPVKVKFRWYEPNRKRDLDNVCFAKKFILDALVGLRIIETDGWKGVIGFTDEFFVDPEHPRIEVEIEEVEQ